eukprot:3480297-Rhodomonas_salina.5
MSVPYCISIRYTSTGQRVGWYQPTLGQYRTARSRRVGSYGPRCRAHSNWPRTPARVRCCALGQYRTARSNRIG